jgi:hypothetical protein
MWKPLRARTVDFPERSGAPEASGLGGDEVRLTLQTAEMQKVCLRRELVIPRAEQAQAAATLLAEKGAG